MQFFVSQLLGQQSIELLINYNVLNRFYISKQESVDIVMNFRVIRHYSEILTSSGTSLAKECKGFVVIYVGNNRCHK